MVKVLAVHALSNSRLALRFSDGAESQADLSSFVGTGGLADEFRDPAYFARVALVPGSRGVIWPNGLDLDPDELYSEVAGKPLPGAKGRDFKAAS